jgi:hypothetical protein
MGNKWKTNEVHIHTLEMMIWSRIVDVDEEQPLQRILPIPKGLLAEGNAAITSIRLRWLATIH